MQFSGVAEKLPGAVKREEIVNERNSRDAQKDVDETSRRHCGPREGRRSGVSRESRTDTLAQRLPLRFEGLEAEHQPTESRRRSFFFQQPVLSRHARGVLRALKE